VLVFFCDSGVMFGEMCNIIAIILQSLVVFMSNVTVLYQRKTVFNNTSQELVINVYQYLKYKAQEMEDSTCQTMMPSVSTVM
jgi:hypothetical protein